MIELVEQNMDLEKLHHIARTSEIPNPKPQTRNPKPLTRYPSVRLGLAWDESFCFYYQDNLDMLTDAGAELVIFSPLHDRELPADLDGIYLGGGYPELHAAALAANGSMREAVRKFSQSGRPMYAECGGFMYLTRAIVDTRGTKHSMAGVYPVVSRMGTRLRRLGYRRVELQRNSLFGDRGACCYGHEFHYSEIDEMPPEAACAYVLDDGRPEGYTINNTLAGYVHLHWGRTPQAARHFIDRLRT
jgi:cobyrinic acid a,c-diamide synthase